MLSQTLIANNNLEIHIVSPAKEESNIIENGIYIHFVKSKQISNIEYIYNNFKSLLPQYRYKGSVKAVIEKVTEINPDIVHVHGTYYPFSMIVLLLKKLTPFPVIYTVHASIHQEIKYTSSVPNRYFIYLRLLPLFYYKKKSLKVADRIIAVSDPIKAIIHDYADRNTSIQVIPNGINIADFDISNFSDTLKHPSILFIGRLVKVKGCEVLIKAIPILKEYYPDIHLYIAGEGDQKDALYSVVSELNVMENVTFLGQIVGDEKINTLKSADLCVFPSKYDAFPFSILEAMACGKAVIASNVGGFPYIVVNGENGLLFESTNIEDLAQKVVYLLRDEHLRLNMGEQGKLRAINLFDWKLISAEVFSKYEECLNDCNKKNS
jgi:glycosyltransferase involved in cell wall biosynthesis